MRILSALPVAALGLGLLIACGGGGGGGGSTPPPLTHGIPDTTFGTNGVVTTSINNIDDEGNALQIQGDGKLVVIAQTKASTGFNHFAVVRYNTNGSLDTSFGTGGVAETTIGTGDAIPAAGVIQSDGKIVAAGSATLPSGVQFALVRYNTDGSLDTTFGAGGIVTTSLASNSNAASGLGLQSDGKLVAAGQSGDSQTQIYQSAMARFNTDGSLDTTYGTGGIVISTWGAGGSWLQNVVIQSDGKAVAAGVSQTSTSLKQFMMARYNTDGSPDTTFGNGGCAITPMGSMGVEVWNLTLQTNGDLVACGCNYTSTNGNPPPQECALARYEANGSLDPGFGTGGKVLEPFGSSAYSDLYCMATDASGNIVASGIYGSSTNTYQATFARFTPTGALDTTFGSQGWTTSTLGYDFSNFWCMALQSNGRIVGAGLASYSGVIKILVARYLP